MHASFVDDEKTKLGRATLTLASPGIRRAAPPRSNCRARSAPPSGRILVKTRGDRAVKSFERMVGSGVMEGGRARSSEHAYPARWPE